MSAAKVHLKNAEGQTSLINLLLLSKIHEAFDI